MKHRKIVYVFLIWVLANLILAACQPQTVEPAKSLVESTQSTSATETVAQVQPAETVFPEVLPEEESALPPGEGQAPADWQVLASDQKEYTLAFPSDWIICQITRHSWVFCDNPDVLAVGDSLPRLYITVFANDYTNQNWEAYNFIPVENLRAYTTLPVGESRPKVPGSPRPEFITYTRLPDRLVGDSTGLVIENHNVWDFPPGTVERIVFLITENTTYIFGMYYETPEQLAMFHQVLDSVRFAPAAAE